MSKEKKKAALVTDLSYLFTTDHLSPVLNRLVSDLQSFLVVLDSENLSYIAQAQKKSISDLLTKLQDAPGRLSHFRQPPTRGIQSEVFALGFIEIGANVVV